MSRKKIAFVVQKDWLTNHFGVRNYFTALANFLEEENNVSYIYHDRNDAGDSMWYYCNVLHIGKEQVSDIPIRLDGQAVNKFTYKEFLTMKQPRKDEKNVDRVTVRCIGNNLEAEQFDCIIVTNPWLVDFQERLPAPRVVGIVYDLIANQFMFTKSASVSSWAYLHNRGYLYYTKYCDAVFAISRVVAEEFNEYYNTDLCGYIEPFPPYAFRNVSNIEEQKENALILAAPFDVRKGLADIPMYIESIKEQVSVLYIFGMPRCSEKEFDHFFQSLPVKHVIYYPYISNEDLKMLYKKSRILLFPSYEEGLGFPLIEAQVCGCRVVTTNKSPMKDLTLEGGYLIQEDVAEKMREMMSDHRYDYSGLQENARKYFSYESIRRLL